MMGVRSKWLVITTFLGATLTTVLGNDILQTSGFTTCLDNSEINVTALNIQYDRSTQQITFDVAGNSQKEQNVTASLYVTAYGKQVYQKDFNPCDDATKVVQLCPGERLLDYHPVRGTDVIFSPSGNLCSPGCARCSIILRRRDPFDSIQRA